MSTLSHQDSRVHRELPSKVTKDRLGQIVHQEVLECGRMAKLLCQQSKAREVLLKSAKKMAKQEVAMENTLSNLRQLEHLVERSLDQANVIGERMEHTSVVQKQLSDLTGVWTS